MAVVDEQFEKGFIVVDAMVVFGMHMLLKTVKTSCSVM